MLRVTKGHVFEFIPAPWDATKSVVGFKHNGNGASTGVTWEDRCRTFHCDLSGNDFCLVLLPMADLHRMPGYWQARAFQYGDRMVQVVSVHGTGEVRWDVPQSDVQRWLTGPDYERQDERTNAEMRGIMAAFGIVAA